MTTQQIIALENVNKFLDIAMQVASHNDLVVAEDIRDMIDQNERAIKDNFS